MNEKSTAADGFWNANRWSPGQLASEQPGLRRSRDDSSERERPPRLGPRRASREQPSAEHLSHEASHEQPSSEASHAEQLSNEASHEALRTAPCPPPVEFDNAQAAAGSHLGGLSEPARRLLAAVPYTREGKTGWLRQLAADEEIAVYLVRHLGGNVTGIDAPFACLLHPDCLVTLTRGRNGQIVYHDPSLAQYKREFQTIPELAAALHTGDPKRLQGLQLALWSLRLLHEAGLIELSAVEVPQVPADSPESVQRARDGFELLVRCRWFLDPGEPVTFARRFVEGWCAIPKWQTRQAIWTLIQQGVLRRVATAPVKHKGWQPATLYLPGEVRPE